MDDFREYFFKQYIKFEPEDGTFVGYHNSDDALKDLTPAAMASEGAFYERVAAIIGKQKLDPIDRAMIETLAQYRLRFIQQNRHLGNIWYSSFPFRVLADQVVRASTPDHWPAIAERISRIPKFLDVQLSNLKTGISVQRIPDRYSYLSCVEGLYGALTGSGGGKRFFTQTVIETATNVLPPGDVLVQELAAVCRSAEEHYLAHIAAVDDAIMPLARQNLKFAMGAEEYSWRLQNVFHLSTSADDLFRDAEYELDRITEIMCGEASKYLNRPISNTAQLRAALGEIRASEGRIPSPGSEDKALAAYRGMAEKASKFIVDKLLFSDVGSLAFDIIWMPPGLTGVAPAANWPALLMDSHSKGYFVVDKARAVPAKAAPNLSVHEAIPGHYLQSHSWQTIYSQDPSPVRFCQIHDEANVVSGFWATMLNIEGFAHYGERLMIDEQFYDDPVERLEAWAGQSLRAMRVIVDVGLHAKQFTVDDAAQLLFEKGLDAESLAAAKSDVVNRYALLPTQAMTYMVGRKQIEQLRAAWSKQNPGDPLSKFHASFLRYGPVQPALMKC
jgi:uncharacterized protein (DUF885 family)